MSQPIVELSAWDLAAAGGLVLVAGAVSLALRIGLERRLALAAARTVIQLLLIGYILEWVFHINRALYMAPVIAVMLVMASRHAAQRPARTFVGASLYAFVSLGLCGLLTTVAVTRVIIGVEPWYKPQYLIPLLGMVLGNGMNGISLCLDYLLEQLQEKRPLIEMELAHGATSWEAARDWIGGAVRRGMIHVINSMMVVGIVSLPGMMTGQILAGNSPIIAVKYQIVVMFMIAAATALGCIAVALLVFRRMFNERHQLVADAIRRQAR